MDRVDKKIGQYILYYQLSSNISKLSPFTNHTCIGLYQAICPDTADINANTLNTISTWGDTADTHPFNDPQYKTHIFFIFIFCSFAQKIFGKGSFFFFQASF